MTFIVPFMYKPWYYEPEEKPYLVYSVNNDDPENAVSWIQGYWKCPHCGEGNQFRFYEEIRPLEYQAKCPNCKKEFVVVDDSVCEEE